MPNYTLASTFAGLPVVDFEPGTAIDPSNAYRLRLDYEAELTFEELFRSFLEDPNAERVEALLFGAWSEEMYDESTAMMVESLVATADRFPRLRGLFLVDVIQEENEISWIVQSDLSPIWSAFPRLEYFTVRGSQSLSLGNVSHGTLREFVIECGGLPGECLRQVAAASLPELEHLELYLGTPNYGWTGTIQDVEAVLAADFPKLRYLGLRDSQIADAVATTVAGSPILERIEELDLSLGTLTDEGGRALLESDGVKSLKRLDLHHHYLSEEMTQSLSKLPIEVVVSDREEPDTYTNEVYRYVAVGE